MTSARDERPGVVLLRNSSPHQVDNPRSLKAEQVAISLLEARGITVGAVIDEQGTSGADLRKRPKAAKLVDELAAGVWQAVAVIEVSRTSRDPDGVDQRIFKRACRRGRALLLTPSKGYDFRNDADDLQYEMESMLSTQEIKKLRRRAFDGNVERARLAPTWFGYVPFGYRPTLGSITIRGTTRTVRQIEKNPDDEQLMLAIGDALDAEGGLQAAAWRLNQAGWTQPNGSAWYWSQVARVLKVPVYCGEYEYGRLRDANSEDLWDGVEVVPSHSLPHLAWYDPERMAVWRQKFAGKQRRIRVRPQGHERPLLGLLLCGLCRHPMISAGIRGYGCSQRREMHCKGQHLSAPQAEGAVRALLVDILPDLSELITQVQAALQAEEAPDLAAELRHVEREITARQELEVEWRLEGRKASPEFVDKSRALQSQREDLERRVQNAESEEAERRQLMQTAARFTDADVFLHMYDHAPTHEKRAALQQLLQWVVVSTNNGRGNRAKAWVSDYAGTFPKSVSESGLRTWLTNLLDAA